MKELLEPCSSWTFWPGTHWCAKAKQFCHMGDIQCFVEGLNFHIPATIRHPHWTLRRMQPVKWECNPKTLCGSCFSSNFRIGALSWNLYSRHTHTHAKIEENYKCIFLPLALFMSMDLRQALNKHYESFHSSNLKTPVSDTDQGPEVHHTSCSCRMTGHYSQLHPVIICNRQLTTNTRHSEFTQSGRQNNSN